MSDEYQLRKDIDELARYVYGNEKESTTDVDTILEKLGLNKESSNKFNFAVITKKQPNLTYEEFWILSNAFYDYANQKFIKIDPTHTSFGIQIQANGTYPMEDELGYMDNTGINFWRNPKKSDVYKDTTTYDYYDYEINNWIGAKRKSDGKWIEWGISSGWSNSFMIDSYGGMTIGGAGFEVDGNGIFPYTRLTSSVYIDENNHKYYLLGLLDNAYHPTLSGWECDSNSTWSWFIGLKTPQLIDEDNNEVYLHKDNTGTKFVVMYNDTSPSTSVHTMNMSDWNTVIEIGSDGITSSVLTSFVEDVLSDHNLI